MYVTVLDVRVMRTLRPAGTAILAGHLFEQTKKHLQTILVAKCIATIPVKYGKSKSAFSHMIFLPSVQSHVISHVSNFH